jgi:hypothetical protein
MFRVTVCPSSGEITVLVWKFVFVTLCRWLSGMQSSTQSDKYKASDRYSCFSWWWAHSWPKHVEKRNKHIKKNCAPIWFYFILFILFTRLYKVARWPKHKTSDRFAWWLRSYVSRYCDHFFIIISIQPYGQFGQEPDPSQATGMALVRCILGKFLGVVCHCLPPRLDVPNFAARCLHVHNNARHPSSEMWNYVRECCRVILPKWRLPRHLGIFYIRYGTDGFTSRPKPSDF